MDDIKKMVLKTRKLTIKEFNELLKNKNVDNKKLFVEGFLRYIFSITKRVYELFENEFNAYYSYEDFFQDCVNLTGQIYDIFTYQEDKDNNFNLFCNYFRLKVPYFLSNTFMFKVSYETWKNVIRNRQKYYKNCLLEDKCEKYWISRVQECMSLEESDISIPSFEDELINSLVKKNLREDLIKILKSLKTNTSDIICKLNGFSLDDTIMEKYTQTELAEEKHMSQQNIADLSKRTYKKIKKKCYYLEDYIR